MITTLQVRVDQKVKQQAQKAFIAMGLDLSSGIKLYLTQVVNTKSIPFPILTAENFSPVYQRRLVAEAKEAIIGGKRYDSVQEMHKDILR